MNILIVGGGGREHALAWQCQHSQQVDQIFVAPGNAGTAQTPGMNNVPIDASDIASLMTFAKKNAIGLTIIGPEAPLVLGIVDQFEQAGLPCFGPSKQAAQLEGSKAFCKTFCERHGIPTAAYASFTDVHEARAYMTKQTLPAVIKADGLAGGKGVVIAHSMEQALQAIDSFLLDKPFTTSAEAPRILIEDFLTGEEASFMALVDGDDVLPLATSQDHKARFAGDKGPNTGGMGAYSPAPVVTDAIQAHIMRDIILPTVAGMQKDGTPYRGFLYAGLMIDGQGQCKLLEYNCRLGDPEAQVILLRMQSDLVQLCLAACEHRLGEQSIAWDTRPALGVVMVEENYPGPINKGAVITGLSKPHEQDTMVFHAGTTLHENQVLTHGGRVLCVCALGDDIQAAQTRAYKQVATLHWGSESFRDDIGYRAIAKTLSLSDSIE